LPGLRGELLHPTAFLLDFTLLLFTPRLRFAQITAACLAVHAVVTADVITADTIPLVADDAGDSAPPEDDAADAASHMGLLPHLLSLSSVALALRLDSKSNHVVWSFC
jgi:hypothetical protein